MVENSTMTEKDMIVEALLDILRDCWNFGDEEGFHLYCSHGDFSTPIIVLNDGSIIIKHKQNTYKVHINLISQS